MNWKDYIHFGLPAFVIGSIGILGFDYFTSDTKNDPIAITPNERVLTSVIIALNNQRYEDLDTINALKQELEDTEFDLYDCQNGALDQYIDPDMFTEENILKSLPQSL